jgi:hypothetical protein
LFKGRVPYLRIILLFHGFGKFQIWVGTARFELFELWDVGLHDTWIGIEFWNNNSVCHTFLAICDGRTSASELEQDAPKFDKPVALCLLVNICKMGRVISQEVLERSRNNERDRPSLTSSIFLKILAARRLLPCAFQRYYMKLPTIESCMNAWRLARGFQITICKHAFMIIHKKLFLTRQWQSACLSLVEEGTLSFVFSHETLRETKRLIMVEVACLWKT